MSKVTAKDYEGTICEIVKVRFCEHCGTIRRQWGTKGAGTTWCGVCSDANGINIKKELRANRE